MWALVVIKANPVANDAAGMLDCCKPVAVGTLLFKRTTHTFDHPFLLWAVRCNELLLQAVATHQRGIIAARKNKPIV